jgi:hypothetical protein
MPPVFPAATAAGKGQRHRDALNMITKEPNLAATQSKNPQGFPRMGAQATGYFLLQLGHTDVAFAAVIAGRDPPVPGKSQVVVWAAGQAAGRRVVLFISTPERAGVWLAPAGA